MHLTATCGKRRRGAGGQRKYRKSAKRKDIIMRGDDDEERGDDRSRKGLSRDYASSVKPISAIDWNVPISGAQIHGCASSHDMNTGNACAGEDKVEEKRVNGSKRSRNFSLNGKQRGYNDNNNSINNIIGSQQPVKEGEMMRKRSISGGDQFNHEHTGTSCCDHNRGKGLGYFIATYLAKITLSYEEFTGPRIRTYDPQRLADYRYGCAWGFASFPSPSSLSSFFSRSSVLISDPTYCSYTLNKHKAISLLSLLSSRAQSWAVLDYISRCSSSPSSVCLSISLAPLHCIRADGVPSHTESL